MSPLAILSCYRHAALAERSRQWKRQYALKPSLAASNDYSTPTSLFKAIQHAFREDFCQTSVVAVGEVLKAIERAGKVMQAPSCEQVNLAFKQMRLEKIRTNGKQFNTANKPGMDVALLDPRTVKKTITPISSS